MLIPVATAGAAPPADITLHGALQDGGGLPLTGTRMFRVTFFDAESSGSQIGSTLSGMTALSDKGLFNIAITPPAGILGTSEVWYELGIDTDIPVDGSAADDVFSQRIRLFSVPFALQAGEVVQVSADRVADGSVSDTEFQSLDGVASPIQNQIDAIDTSGISTNAAGITQNSTDIGTNATAITQNTTDIGTNTTAIALKANSADVYTQGQADANFVDTAGDTMTGDLAITDTTGSTDTDSGALTVDGGIGINGALNTGGNADLGGTLTLRGLSMVLGDDTNVFTFGRPAAAPGQAGAAIRIAGQEGDTGQDGGAIELAPGSGAGGGNPGGIVIADGAGTPTVTVNTLYNNGGNLFWNGTQVDASSIDKDAINNTGTLGFTWADGEVANGLTISGGSVAVDSFSAIADLAAENAVGTGAAQVAAGDHGHNLQDLSGAVTDGQVPDTISIAGGSVANDSFSAISDLGAESAIGAGSAQVAAGDHSHDLQDLGGAVTDAQVPDAISIEGGSVNNDSFSAYSDLGAESRLDNDDGGDLLTRTQLDARFAPVGGGGGSYILTGVVSDDDETTLAGLFDSTAFNAGSLLSSSEPYPRFTGFFPPFATQVFDAIHMFVNETTTYDGTQVTSMEVQVRNAAGAVQHTMTTSVVNLTSGPRESWISLDLSADEADRTVENGEYMVFQFTTTGSSSTGTYAVLLTAEVH